MAILGLEGFVFFQGNRRRRKSQGRKGPLRKKHKAQQGDQRSTGRGQVARQQPAHTLSSQEGGSPPANQPVQTGWDSHHLPPVSTSASSTLTAAGGNSGPVEIRNGTCGHRQERRLKQFPCNGERENKNRLTQHGFTCYCRSTALPQASVTG